MLITACMRVVSERAKNAGVTLGFDGENANFLFLGDERKMKQIIINLLSNAVKFTLSGGRIDVRWQIVEDRCCELIVWDTGIGIGPDDLARVLQPFAQAESGLNRRYEGTGLGLPLTRGLVELHGGSFRLESELGRGTRAIIEFPLNRVHLDRRAAACRHRSAGGAAVAGASGDSSARAKHTNRISPG